MNVYNVYDDGELMLENVTREEIIKNIGSAPVRMSEYINRKLIYRDKYSFLYGNSDYVNSISSHSTAMDNFAKRWSDAIRPFKKVEWSKTEGRKLLVGGKNE